VLIAGVEHVWCCSYGTWVRLDYWQRWLPRPKCFNEGPSELAAALEQWKRHNPPPIRVGTGQTI
jgi:hypothetical protein